MTSADISIEHVTKRFGTHVALEDVSLEIAGGELIVVLGPSGCGKTTLLRLIAGLDLPDRGRIRLNGQTVSEGNLALIPPHRRHMGFVFQDLALWPHFTVRQHLEFVLDSGTLPRVERLQRVRETLDLARISALGERYPHELSGGEQQRVALARALVGTPSVFLLDEPLSSLDPALRSALRDELARLQRVLNVTTLYVTHDPEDARELATRIVQMQKGRISDIQVNPAKDEPV